MSEIARCLVRTEWLEWKAWINKDSSIEGNMGADT